VTGESGRQVDPQVVTLLGPNKRMRISQQVNFRARLHRRDLKVALGALGCPRRIAYVALLSGPRTTQAPPDLC